MGSHTHVRGRRRKLIVKGMRYGYGDIKTTISYRKSFNLSPDSVGAGISHKPQSLLGGLQWGGGGICSKSVGNVVLYLRHQCLSPLEARDPGGETVLVEWRIRGSHLSQRFSVVFNTTSAPIGVYILFINLGIRFFCIRIALSTQVTTEYDSDELIP